MCVLRRKQERQKRKLNSYLKTSSPTQYSTPQVSITQTYFSLSLMSCNVVDSDARVSGIFMSRSLVLEASEVVFAGSLSVGVWVVIPFWMTMTFCYCS